MEEKNFRYDAFISYRHCELDKFVAENLHKILESYDLPKSIKKKLNIEGKTFNRVFRDQEELPLSSNLEDPIIDALESSKYLIVICSPRLKDSLWCKKEIKTFKKLRGRKNIFCVLIEGEPSDSFPEEVLYDEEKVTTKDGKTKTERIMVEPLAADVRGKNNKEVLKKIKEEKLRLIAPMFNLNYDDLKQRQKLREQKRIMTIALTVAAFSIAFAIYSLAMFIKINTQQNILATHQALSLSEKSTEFLKKDNRYDAIRLAYNALTEFEDVKMPYTNEAEYALNEALSLYDVGASYKSITELQTDGVVDYIKSTTNSKYMAIYDESEHITLFDSGSLKVIKKFDVKGTYMNKYSFGFLGNDYLSYINDEGGITIVKADTGEEYKKIEKDKDRITALRCEKSSTFITYITNKKLFVYNIKEDKVVGSISSKDDFIRDVYYSEESDYVFAATSPTNFDINREDSLTMHIISTKDGKEINNFTVTAGYISGLYTKGNNVYVLLNNTLAEKYSAIALSYNYIEGKMNWQNNYDNTWSRFIIKSYKDGTNELAITSSKNITILNAKDGKEIESFSTDSEIINIYSFITSNMYLVFLANGDVNYVNVDTKKSILYDGKFLFNLDKYIDALQSENGFVLIPENDNRIILYEEKKNPEAQEIDVKIDYPSTDTIGVTEVDKIKDEFGVKNRNLVDKMLYDSNKEILFVNYKNNDIAIYNVADKKLINTITNVGKVSHYFGKDKYGRTYIGDVSHTYVFDKDYKLVGHINKLAKIEDDKVIIRDNDKFYSIKIYTLENLLNEAKKYLGE